MKYIYFNFENIETWIELDSEKYALRQVNQGDTNTISCRQDALAEGIVDDINCDVITNDEFETVWQQSIKQYADDWEELKIKYPIGAYIEGVIKCFYPQGSVIEIEGNMIARTMFPEPTHTQINVLYHGTVIGYDEQNMWLVLN